MFPEVKSYAGINQNYAFGQDSWRDFELSMKVVMPETRQSEKVQFPKLFAGQYGTEISALSLGDADLVHSSFWGGDLEGFIFQAAPRGVCAGQKVILTVGGNAIALPSQKRPARTNPGAQG